MLYRQRERFNKLSVKVGIIFSRLGLSPNQWTLLTLLPTFAALYFLVREQFLLSAAFFIIASFIDLIDGSVARVTG
ncbi:MAG: CDP-alcohol phosphatidyltransferase family protein, partial [Candidatus Aenigmarchaeota archaeon]|nr:CDP-alcohol phosphatidyltransferase family protein [Candidatus Aenigmarchaeota archaeon]